MESLIVPGELNYLDDVADFVYAAAEMADLDERATYQLRLSVDEIATNIILHGYEEAGRDGDLRLTAVMTSRQLVIHLEDTGVAYDPTKRPLPTSLSAPAHEREIGGLGIYLALAGVDDFRYTRFTYYNRSSFIVDRQPVLISA
ncbi:MAG: ATP-binding protein [Chloroflexota bacterium]